VEAEAVLLLKPTAISIPKSRKENIQDSSMVSEPMVSGGENAVRKVTLFAPTNSTGTKRQRVVTPAASKVIDDEDEPRSSPSLRKTSLGSAKDFKEGERKILGGIENMSETT
jgi:hypothetical protein